MSQDRDPSISIIELQEEFVQHMERGGRKIILLALIAVVSGAYFALNYFLQLIVLPYGLGIRSQTVNLVDPALVAVGTVSFVISLLWLYAGLRNLMFGRRLEKRIKQLRELQAQAAQKYGLGK